MKREDLLKRLSASAARFGFFELVRALGSALKSDIDAVDSPDLERVHFAHDPSLAFPVTDVVKVAQGDVVEVTTSFLGLLGNASPLSVEWTDDVLLGDEDGLLQAFYDVFHHRALAYLFSAWRALAAEGSFDLRGGDVRSARLRSLAGVDAWAPGEADPLHPMVALGLADHQHGQPQSIDEEAAERLLRRFFPDLSLRLETRVSRFIPFTASERARLGSSRAKLNGGLVYGDGCQDDAGAVRIHVGPVDAVTYEDLMPGGAAYVSLEQTAARVFGGTVDVELEVHLHRDHAPALKLGRREGSRLGIDARYGDPRHEFLSVRVPLIRGGHDLPRVFLLSPEDG